MEDADATSSGGFEDRADVGIEADAPSDRKPLPARSRHPYLKPYFVRLQSIWGAELAKSGAWCMRRLWIPHDADPHIRADLVARRVRVTHRMAGVPIRN